MRHRWTLVTAGLAVLGAAATVGCSGGSGDAKATTTTSEAEVDPGSIRSYDLENRSYDIFCDGSGAVTTIDVTDGAWTSPEGPELGSLNYFGVEYADVTGDGQEDAVVNMDCSVGMGSNAWGNTVVLEATTDEVSEVGQPIPSHTWIIDGELIGEVTRFEDSDPMCCPSSIDQSTWVYRSGGWSQENTQRIAAEDSYTINRPRYSEEVDADSPQDTADEVDVYSTVRRNAIDWCSDPTVYDGYGTTDKLEIAASYASTLSPEYREVAEQACLEALP